METVAVGIDVSKATLDVCVLVGLGAKPKHRRFKNGEDGFKKMVDWVLAQAPDGPRHFCMEATGTYGFGAAAYLADNGHKVSVENPRPVKHLAIALGLKAKTDKVDAFCIARYVQVTNPREWTLRDPRRRELAQLHTRIHQLDKQRLAERSRLDDRYLPEFIRTQTREHIDHLAGLIQEVEAQVRELMSSCETARVVYKAVTGLIGVGPETGLLLAGLDILSFDHAQQVPTFFGLSPRLFRSGRFCGETHITKCGDGVGRAILMSAANSAAQHNPALKEFFETRISNGLKRKQAIAAVARKLVMIAWAVARNALLGRPVSYPGGELRTRALRVYCA
jgi:transposase